MRARFSAPVKTGPGVHSASCTRGTGSFPGVKRPGRGADHPPPSKRRVHERVEPYLYSQSGLQWPVIGRTFTFTFYIYAKECFLSRTKRSVREVINITHNPRLP